MSIDIVTTTFRNIDKLKICLSSVLARTKFVDFKWYLWCNDANDKVRQIINDAMTIDVEHHIVPIYNLDNNGTFSSNNNACVTKGTGEYILFLNDDCEPLSDSWLLNLEQILDSDPKVGAVGSLLLYPGTNQVQHAGVMFDQKTNGLPFHIYYKQPLNRSVLIDKYFQIVTGACMLTRRADFEKLGGFNTRYKYGFEDCSYCLSLKHELGKNVVYCSSSKLYHHEGISGKFKKHPHLQENIKVFKEMWGKKIFNDHQFYLSSPGYMVYRAKTAKENMPAGIILTGSRKLSLETLDMLEKVKKCNDEGDIERIVKEVNSRKEHIDISFITCVNSIEQYRDFTVPSVIKNDTEKQFELIPVFNFGNKYSAAQALNIGIDKARGELLILCHQDVTFLEKWIDNLYNIISKIEISNKKWGVLGTAGVAIYPGGKIDTAGVVYGTGNVKHWRPSNRSIILKVQTVDEHCMIIRKSNRFRFDEQFNGFHMYGGDLSISAITKGFTNYGIICPLIHETGKGTSLSSEAGKKDYNRSMDLFAKKWKDFDLIRTTTATIRNGVPESYVDFDTKIGLGE